MVKNILKLLVLYSSFSLSMSSYGAEIIFELINESGEDVSFAVGKVGTDPEKMKMFLKEIASKKKVSDKIQDTERQILIKTASEQQLYIISEKPGKHFKLKFSPKRPLSKEMTLQAQVFALSNISTSDIVLTKREVNGTWQDVAVKEEKPKKEESKKEDPKKADTSKGSKSESNDGDDDDKTSADDSDAESKDSEAEEEKKKSVTAFDVLGVKSKDDATRDREVLGMGDSKGRLTFSSALSKSLSSKKSQQEIESRCEKLVDLWSGEGAVKKERDKIMAKYKVPEEDMDEVASDAHGLIEKTCERIKGKFAPSDDDEDSKW